MKNRYLTLALLTGLLAAFLKIIIADNSLLGNDEVYYTLYGLFPDWSHFDHPPMVGLFIQLTTLNFAFTSELAIRASGIMFGLLNTFLIYKITEQIGGSRAGFFASILFNTSIYCLIIAGTFILPDTPMLVFWLIAIWFLINSVTTETINSKARWNIIFAGIAIGLAMISKYHSVFLWFGSALYILFFNRLWLREKSLYVAIALSLIIFSPVVYWNMTNELASVAFHSGRVGVGGLRIDFILSELLGSIFYNNPANYFIIATAIIAFFAKKRYISGRYFFLLFLISAPLILTFFGFSLFKRTLPHWSAPAFTNFIIIAGIYLDYLMQKKENLVIPNSIKVAIAIIVAIVPLALLQINLGLLRLDNSTNPIKIGKKDPTLDMYGWDKIAKPLSLIIKNDLSNGIMPSDAAIVSYRWFPTSHFDWYVARPLERKLLAYGPLINKYMKVNKMRGELQKGESAYFLTSSRDFRNPEILLADEFQAFSIPDTIRIERRGIPAYNIFVYRMWRKTLSIPRSY